MNIRKKYPKEDITIVWQPKLCRHSTNCFKGMPHVFNPEIKPWIKPENAEKENIIAQVKQCPSGALSIEFNNIT